MSRKKKAHRKDTKWKGEVGELGFAFKAASLGYAVAKPYGESLPYDFLVDGGGIVTRVQVKTTSAMQAGAYFANAQRHSPFSSRPYTPEEVEIIAVWVMPLDVWYLIPLGEILPRKGIRLWPHRAENDTRYGKYRERWEVLGRPKLEIMAAADDDTAAQSRFADTKWRSSDALERGKVTV